MIMRRNEQLEVDALSQEWISSLSRMPGARFVLKAVNSQGAFSSYFDYLDDVAKQLGFGISVLEGKSMASADVFTGNKYIDLDIPAIRIKCQYDRYGKKVLEKSGNLCERIAQNDLQDSFFVFADTKPKIKQYFKLAMQGLLSYVYNWRLALLSVLIVAGSIFKNGVAVGLPFAIVLFLLSFVGLYLSLSTSYGEGGKDVVSEKICPKKKGQKKSNCEKVGGVSGDFWGLISYTELGVLFFTTTILTYAISLVYGGSYNSLFVPSLIFGVGGVAFSIHSVVTQLKIGVFCKICGLIILIPYLVVATSWLAMSAMAIPGIELGVEFFGVILTAWAIAATDRYVQYSNQKLFKLQANYKYDLYRFIDNEDVWRVLYGEAPVLDAWGQVLEESIDLNPVDDGAFSDTIVLIVSLHCAYCHEALKKCRSAIDNGVGIAFKVMIEDTELEEDSDSPSVYLLSILKNEGVDAFLKALEVWYVSRDLSLFKKTLTRRALKDEAGLAQTRKQLLLQQDLLQEIPYMGAPSLLLNGKVVNRMYQFDYLVDKIR